MKTDRLKKCWPVVVAAMLIATLLAPGDLEAQKLSRTSGSSSSSSGSSSSSSSGSSSGSGSSSVSSSSGSASGSHSSGRVSRGSGRVSRGSGRVSRSGRVSISRAPGPARLSGSDRPTPISHPPRPRPIPRVAGETDPPVPPPKSPEKPGTPPPDVRPPHRPHYPYYPHHPGYDYRFFGSWYPYSFFHGPYGYFYYPYYPYTRRAYVDRNVLGALDLNVKPKKAEVYIDGDPVGAADRYDGFPSYLWLAPGTYTISFYLEGYETLTREYRVHPGLVIKVKERLKKGVASEPVELFPKVPAAAAPAAPPAAEDTRAAVEDEAEAVAPPLPGAIGEEGIGRMELSVQPGDAAVYLDGHFLGTGEELSQLSAGMIVEPGTHRLEVVRPGYKTEQVKFEIAAGEQFKIDVLLRKR